MFTKEVEIREVELEDCKEEGGGLGTLNYGILENCESNLVKFCEYMVLTCSFLSPLELEGMV